MSIDNKDSQFEEFIKAIEEGNKEKVEELIKQGVNINRQIKKQWERYNNKNDYYITPLILSIEKDDDKITKLLLDNGAKVNVSSMLIGQVYRPTALYEAVEKGNYKLVYELIKKGAKLNVARRDRTPLENIVYKITKEEAKNNKNTKKIEVYTNIAKLLIDKGARYEKVLGLANKLENRTVFDLMMKKEDEKNRKVTEIENRYIQKYKDKFAINVIETYLKLKEKKDDVDIRKLEPKDLDALLVLMDYIKNKSNKLVLKENTTKEITSDDLYKLEDKAPIYIRGVVSAVGLEFSEGTAVDKRHNEEGLDVESRKLQREPGEETLTNISGKKTGNENRCVTMINYGNALPFVDVGYGIIKGNVEELKGKNIEENINENIKGIHMAGEHDLWTQPNKEIEMITSKPGYEDVENLPIDTAIKNIFNKLKNSKRVEAHNEIVMDVEDKDVKFIFWRKFDNGKYKDSPSKLKAIYFQRKYKEKTGRTVPIFEYKPGEKDYLRETNLKKENIIDLLKEELISKDGKGLKEKYKEGRALNFLLAFKDEIAKISEEMGNNIINKYIDDKISQYSDKNKGKDIYETVNFVKFVGAMQGENKQQEVFEKIFKDLDLYPTMRKYFSKDWNGKILFNRKTTFFAVEMMSAIRALATNEKTIDMVVPRLKEILQKIGDLQYGKIEQIKDALDSSNSEILRDLSIEDEDLDININGKKLLQYVLEKCSGEEKEKKIRILLEKYDDAYMLSDVLISMAQNEYMNEENQEYIFNLLLEKDCDLDESDKYQKTALHYAAYNNNENIVKLLLKNGASTNKIDEFGKTALHYAVENDNENIASLLLEHEVDINKGDKEGRTVLHYAVLNDNANMVNLLLDHGASINVIDKDGNTPLLYLERQREELLDEEKKTNMRNLLIEKGADISVTKKRLLLKNDTEKKDMNMVKPLIKISVDKSKDTDIAKDFGGM